MPDQPRRHVTRAGIERVARFAAEVAAQRSGLVVSATKSNGLIHTMRLWDEVVSEVISRREGVRVEHVLVDALTARAVLRPGSLDVIVASNLFGDVLSDLIAALAGSIGVAPSANLNPPANFPPCSSRYTGPPRTSAARAWRILSVRCGPAR
jgi:tartrate dehydrogenase/decarboxylase / D-malate dehydrogenase